MVDEPSQSAVSSISVLANRFGVNPSTLTRLSKRLGYAGFNELQSVFRGYVSGDTRSWYSRRVGALVASEADAVDDPTLAVLLRAVRDESSNLTRLAEGIDTLDVHTASELMCHSRNLRVHGLRQFYSLANFLSYGLGLIRDGVSMLGDGGHGVAHALSQMTRDDALVVLGCTPYTRATVDASRVAVEAGIPLIAFTDSSASPLAANARAVFVIPSGGSFYVNSTAAWITLIEALLNVVAQRLGERAVATLKSRERLFERLGVPL